MESLPIQGPRLHARPAILILKRAVRRCLLEHKPFVCSLAMRVVTLTTDFGLNDWFVGTMKGVILGINARIPIVDITHQVPPGDVRAGAFALLASYSYFPKHTVHVAVVDPGVGSARAAIAIETANYFFVGPDNGVLSLALAEEKVRHIHRLENPKYFCESISRTFHGRDVFASVAGYLSRKTPLRHFGPAQEDLVRTTIPASKRSSAQVAGEIIYIDHFGNAITNLRQTDSRLRPGEIGRLTLPNERRRIPIAQFYQEVETGKPVAVLGSTGFLEIAINGGNAARTFRLKIGSRVILHRSSAE